MKEYILLFRGGVDYAKASPDQLQQTMMKWKDWMDKLGAEGKLKGGERLSLTGAVIKGTEKQVSRGPYAEGHEVVSGYLLILADSLEAAIDMGKACPIYADGGSTEIQEIAKM